MYFKIINIIIIIISIILQKSKLQSYIFLFNKFFHIYGNFGWSPSKMRNEPWSVLLTFCLLTLKSQPKSHWQWSLVCVEQTPLKEQQNIVNKHVDIIISIYLFVWAHAVPWAVAHLHPGGKWYQLQNSKPSISTTVFSCFLFRNQSFSLSIHLSTYQSPYLSIYDNVVSDMTDLLKTP